MTLLNKYTVNANSSSVHDVIKVIIKWYCSIKIKRQTSQTAVGGSGSV